MAGGGGAGQTWPMRYALPLLLLLCAPALAGENAVQVVNGIRMIDATKLTVAELQAMAADERESATRVQCCDWGGGGCNPATARAMMGLGERIGALGVGG